ncbi:MAG: GNAT family N-acetyltransferase [Thermoguttaceae bacterium]
MPPLSCRVIDDAGEFAALRPRWDALAKDAAYPNIFTTWEWVSIWWKHFACEPQTARRWELFVVVVENHDSEIVGIFPWYRVVGTKQINWLGFGARPCAEYLGPIIHRDSVDAVAEAVVEFLGANPNQWNTIFFEDYALDDTGTVAFASALKRRFVSRAAEGEPRYYISLPDSYAAYLQTLTSHNRGKKKNRLNQSKSRYSATTSVVTVETLDEGFSALVNLTTQSRIRAGQDSPFQNRAYAAFHRELLETLLPLNRAELFLLNYAEVPAGIWYTYTLGGKVYGYQQGCASQCDGSPGDVTLQNLLIHLIENRFEEFDFLRGGEWYKTSYTETTRPTETLTIYRTRNVKYYRDAIFNYIYRPLKRFVKRMVEKWT